jgi:serine protease Do
MIGDVVVGVNGVAVKSSSDLTRQVARVRGGDTLRLDIIREGKRRIIEVRSGVRPSERELAQVDGQGGGPGRPPSGGSTAASAPVLGMALSPLDPAARTRLNLPPEVRGAVVDTVDQSSDAGTKGMRRGDVITLANSRPVTSSADLAAVVDAAKKAGRTSVLVGVYRNGRTAFLPLKIAG